MKNKINTKNKRPLMTIFILVIALILITIIITIYLSNRRHNEIVRLATEQFNQQQLILAHSAAISIGNFMHDIEDDLFILSNLAMVQKMESEILKKMESLHKEIGYITSLRQLNKDGILCCVYPLDWRQELIGRDYKSGDLFSRG